MVAAATLALVPVVASTAAAAPAAPTPVAEKDPLSVAAAAALLVLDEPVEDAGEPGATAPSPGDDVVVADPSPVVKGTPVAESDVVGASDGTDETGAVAETEPVDPEAVAMAEVAELVAERVDVDAEDLIEAWSSTTEQRYRVVLAALAQVGDGYRYASAGPDLFDCSGLSKYAWSTVGVSLFHNSSRQITASFPRKVAELQPGDLVWRPGHVMLYLGVDDLIVNAVQPGKPVTVKKWGKVYRYGSPIPEPEPIAAQEPAAA